MEHKKMHELQQRSVLCNSNRVYRPLLLPYYLEILSRCLLCIVQDPGLMYYCNTCSQPLCSSCRELTHKARMFSHHEIVSMAKRTKAKHRKCCKKKRNLNFHET